MRMEEACTFGNINRNNIVRICKSYNKLFKANHKGSIDKKSHIWKNTEYKSLDVGYEL